MAFGGKRRRLTPQELARLCSYTTTMGRCPFARVTLTKDGARFPSPYCKLHCCKKIDNNAACIHPKSNSRGYCQQHLMCTGTINGQRCNNYIKSYDPKEFRFCAQFHNCLQPGCANERARQNDTDLRHCPDHRCSLQDCPSARTGGGSIFCVAHTCSSEACLAPCPAATGDAGDPSRYCERHRVCATANCRRFTHLHENGVPSRYCGAHYCRWEGGVRCDAERAANAEGTCEAHTCTEAGCGRARKETSSYCKDHACTFRDCRAQRWMGEFCPNHKCAMRWCPRKGEFDHYCDRHRTCMTPGCDRFRMIDGENVKEHCEEHSITRCVKEGCNAPVVNGAPYCENHLCSWRPCNNERVPFGADLCNLHKCAVVGCPHRRTHRQLSEMHAMLVAAGAAQWAWSAYCQGHACRSEGCQRQSLRDSHFCQEHVPCRHPGCDRVVDANGLDPALCAHHNRRAQREVRGQPFGYGGGWPGVGDWGLNAAM